jgi:porin
MSVLFCFHRFIVTFLLAGMVGLVVGRSPALAQPPAASGEQLTSASPTDQPKSRATANSLTDTRSIERPIVPNISCPEAADDKPAQPEPVPFGGPFLERPNLTGDWFGTRTAMRESGINWNIYSTNFYSGVATGGLNDMFGYRGRDDYLLHVDGEKAGLWQGLFIDLHGESVYGTNTNRFTGTLLPVSLAQSLPISKGSVTALTGVKITQALSENFVVFGGKLNTLDGFNQPFTGGARGVDGFQNTALLFNAVSIRTVPYTTFGAGFAVLNKDQEAVFSVAVFDTNDTPTVSGFDTFFDNGMTVYASANLPTKFFGLPGHQGFSGAYSSGTYSNLQPSPYIDPIEGLVLPNPSKKGSWYLAYAFDQAMYVSPEDPKRSWGVFGNLGLADSNPSPVHWAANIGLGGSSPLPNRKQDSFGVGYFYTGISDSLKQLAPRLLPIRDEQGVELFYNIAVTPWCHITPDLQVVNPGRERADTLLFLGLRAKIDF